MVADRQTGPEIAWHADRSYVKVGMCITFTWDVRNAAAVYFYSDQENWPGHQVAAQANQQVCQQQTTTYTLRVIGLDGTEHLRQIRIPVEPLPGL